MSPSDGWTVDDAERLRAAVGRFVRAGRARSELPPAQAALLGLLDRDGPSTITELADRLQVRHQSARATVALLQERGLIATARDADDARRVICTMTAPGRARLDADRRRRTDWIRRAVDERLTPAQRAVAGEIAAILDRLAEPAPDGDSR